MNRLNDFRRIAALGGVLAAALLAAGEAKGQVLLYLTG